MNKTRREELEEDREIVEYLYWKACQQCGVDAVNKDFTRMWDLRCSLGMAGRLPFGGMRCTSLDDVLWVAHEVCNLPETAEDVFLKFNS